MGGGFTFLYQPHKRNQINQKGQTNQRNQIDQKNSSRQNLLTEFFSRLLFGLYLPLSVAQ